MKLAATLLLGLLLGASTLVAEAGVKAGGDVAASQGKSVAVKPEGNAASQVQVPVRGLVQRAIIDNLSPGELAAGLPLSVTVTLYLYEGKRASLDDLESQLRVYVDSQEAQPLVRGVAPDGASSAAATGKAQITLRVTAPSPLPAGRTVTVSVYSTADRRDVAFEKIEVGAMALGASSPTSSTAVRNEAPQWSFIAGGLVGVALITVLAFLIRRWVVELSKSRQRISDLELQVAVAAAAPSSSANAAGTTSATPRPVPPGQPAELPAGLLEALRRGELVLVIGAGVSAQAGLPTSRTLWLELLDQAASSGTTIDPDLFERVKGLVATGSSESAAETVVSLLGRDKVLEGLHATLIESREPAALHELLARLPWRAVIDLTWDDLMPKALASRTGLAQDAPKQFTPLSHEGIAQTLREGRLALLKPLGRLGGPDGVALTHREYRLALSRAPEFERSMAAMFATRTLLFMGFSLEGLEQFLGGLPPSLDAGDRRHFALMPANAGMVDIWESGLGRRFGVQLLSFHPSPDWRELGQAALTLLTEVSATQSAGAKHPQAVAPGTERLQYLHLKSIGLFRDLRVNFEPGWTVLLGSNGGGKSTILRAVVLALAGNDARAQTVAGRLLRSGERSGSVELGIGNSTMTCTLVRDGPKVLLQSPQTTLLQAGQVLVLGFPALRGLSTTAVRGPTSVPAANPSVDDVGPLLLGGVDGRLDNLQQWVVNTALRAEGSPKGREAQMMSTFQQILTDIVPGGELRFARVDRETWQVILSSRDGEVRFDSVSQGMSAILNWVGILLQRLYDVYPSSLRPENEAAIVLVDEIDAHLHPDWQRRLVWLCRRHFENVQFIVSTHSPMLAGSVAAKELRLVARDEDGEVSCKQPMVDMQGQKAEDILVSPLFQLDSTRNMQAEQDINEYTRLFEKLNLEPHEQERLNQLSHRADVLNYGGSIEERHEVDALRARVHERLARLADDSAQETSS